MDQLPMISCVECAIETTNTCSIQSEPIGTRWLHLKRRSSPVNCTTSPMFSPIDMRTIAPFVFVLAALVQCSVALVRPTDVAVTNHVSPTRPDYTKCINAENIRFNSIESFTSSMCLKCLDTMRLHAARIAWSNFSFVSQWNINVTEQRNVIHWKSNNQSHSYELIFKDIANSIKHHNISNHFILKQFSSIYFMVTLWITLMLLI